MFEFAVLDRLREMPYRLSEPAHAQAQTWPLSEHELGKLAIVWPTKYEWDGCTVIVQTIKDAFERLGVLRQEPTPQTYKGVVMLSSIHNGRSQAVALDYSDYHNFINEEALAKCNLYIKAQYRASGYGDPRIVRGGYPVTHPRYYLYYVPFRLRGNRCPTIEIVGRFGYTFQEEIRRRAVAMLSADRDLDFVGSAGKVRYSHFLREVAAARLSLHLPGNGPFTHRIAEFLGLGTCMVAVRLATELHVPLVPGEHYVEIAEDLSDLREKIYYYLAHEEERARIAAAGRAYFDRYLHAEQLVAYYARMMMDRLSCT